MDNCKPCNVVHKSFSIKLHIANFRTHSPTYNLGIFSLPHSSDDSAYVTCILVLLPSSFVF